VQIAKAFGAEVTGPCLKADVDAKTGGCENDYRGLGNGGRQNSGNGGDGMKRVMAVVAVLWLAAASHGGVPGLLNYQGRVVVNGTNVNGTVKTTEFNGKVNASGGFVIENRTSDPASPAVGQMWLRTDL
jgi:hypothetical protein